MRELQQQYYAIEASFRTNIYSILYIDLVVKNISQNLVPLLVMLRSIDEKICYKVLSPCTKLLVQVTNRRFTPMNQKPNRYRLYDSFNVSQIEKEVYVAFEV